MVWTTSSKFPVILKLKETISASPDGEFGAFSHYKQVKFLLTPNFSFSPAERDLLVQATYSAGTV
jgi:hypothetical protein